MQTQEGHYLSVTIVAVSCSVIPHLGLFDCTKSFEASPQPSNHTPTTAWKQQKSFAWTLEHACAQLFIYKCAYFQSINYLISGWADKNMFSHGSQFISRLAVSPPGRHRHLTPACPGMCEQRRPLNISRQMCFSVWDLFIIGFDSIPCSSSYHEPPFSRYPTSLHLWTAVWLCLQRPSRLRMIWLIQPSPFINCW